MLIIKVVLCLTKQSYFLGYLCHEWFNLLNCLSFGSIVFVLMSSTSYDKIQLNVKKGDNSYTGIKNKKNIRCWEELTSMESSALCIPACNL